MHRVILPILLAAGLLLWLKSPDAERLERLGLESGAILPKAPTAEEIVRYTNDFRSAHGLPPLTINDALNAAAQARALDMKTHGYFAHHNPGTGKGPSEAIAEAAYAARASAENIAKGNWRSSQALVQGWIDSPGHRANILNPEMREIGVGLARDSGLAAGRPYYAVQLFGKPLSDCGELPGDLDRAAIQEVDSRLERLDARLRDRQRVLDDLQSRIDRSSNNVERNQWIRLRNQHVTEFNQLVEEARGVQGTLSAMIDAFNARVADFNACGTSR